MLEINATLYSHTVREVLKLALDTALVIKHLFFSPNLSLEWCLHDTEAELCKLHFFFANWCPAAAAAAAKSLRSCPTLCDLIDGSPPGSPVPGILQARTLEWVAISFSNAWKWKVWSESEVAQPCPTLSNPRDCSSLRPWDFPGKSNGVGCHFLASFC